MEEARAEPGHGRDPPGVPHRGPHRAERRLMRIVALEIGEEAQIASGPQLVEQRLQERSRVGGSLGCEEAELPFAQDWLAQIERARPLIVLDEEAGLDLGGLDVGLVERIDADDRAGDRRCDFPAEEFLRR